MNIKNPNVYDDVKVVPNMQHLLFILAEFKKISV